MKFGKTILFKVLIFFFLIQLHQLSPAQKLRFKKITPDISTISSEVYCFLKDSHGFMWIGTIDGLYRYDSYNLRSYKIDRYTPNSLSDNTIRCLAEDEYGRIWIGTNKGLNIFDIDKQLFKKVHHPDFEAQGTAIWSIQNDGDLVWIATCIGLYLVKNTKDTELLVSRIKKVSIPFKGPDDLKIRYVTKSSSDVLWLCSNRKTACFKYQAEKNKLLKIDLPSEFDSIHGFILSEDSAGNIWIATRRDGLYRYIPYQRKITHFSKNNSQNSLPSNQISSVTSDKLGNVWIGTFDRGLCKIEKNNINKDTSCFEIFQYDYQFPKGINTNLIRNLYVSDDNILWVGTLGSGVNKYDPGQKKFEYYQIPQQVNASTTNSNFIRSVFVDSDKNIWLGAYNAGCWVYNPSIEKYKKIGFDTKTVFQINEFKKNAFWISTSKGVYKLSTNNNIIEADRIDNDRFFHSCTTKSANNIFWSTNLKGLKRIEYKPHGQAIINHYDQQTKYALSVKNSRIVIYDGTYNELWVGTEGGGVNIVGLDSLHFPNSISVLQKGETANDLSNNYVRTIYKQNDSTYWIGTYEGLNKVIRRDNTYMVKVFDKRNGLADNLIQSILEDDNSNLWIGTNGGLIKLNTRTDEIRIYDKSDGLQSNVFSENACCKAEDGKLFFGGINGISAFYPQEINESIMEPQATITAFNLRDKQVTVNTSVNGRILLKKPVFQTDTIVLKPKENDFGFEFSAMLFSNPEKIKYKYRLEGYDDKWIQTTSLNRIANYTNLGFGDYLFKVQATNSDGKWFEHGDEIFIHIHPPFYLSWIAFILYAVVFVSIVIYFMNYSVIKITTKKELVLEKEHSDKLQELNSLRTKFFINISHDLRTPLTLISGPVQGILENLNISKQELKKQLLLIDKNAQRLKYLVEQLLDFRKVECGKLKLDLIKVQFNRFLEDEASHFSYNFQEKNIQFKFEAEEESLWFYNDTEKTRRVIFNLLSNALKFTDKGYVSIKTALITSEELLHLNRTKNYEKYVKVIVSDSGKGIAAEKIKHIFDRFYQDDQNTGRGYGIGLSHSRDLIDIQGGFIYAESNSGQGTSIIFYLPFIEEVPAESIKKQSTSKKQLPSITPIASDKQSAEIESNDEHEPKVNSENIKKVLIVEDNSDMREYIKSGLLDTYEIFEATDGKQGLKASNKIFPDLIISDIMMPNMDGIEFCKRIKTTIATSHIPVILLTARIDVDLKYKGLENGADDYLGKPFDMYLLRLRINNLIKSRELLQQKFKNNTILDPSVITVSTIDEKFMKKLYATVEKQLENEEFTVASLEKEMGMSHGSFYNKMKSLTGMSGNEFLRDMRLKRACQILSQNPQIRISDLCYMVGFTDPRIFSRCFKERYGLIPSKFNKFTSSLR